jgi:hypothetical protein
MDCTYCGEELAEGAKACARCGARAPQARMDRKAVVAFAAAFLFVAAAISGIYLLKRNESQDVRVIKRMLDAIESQDYDDFRALFDAEVQKRLNSEESFSPERFQLVVDSLAEGFTEAYSFGQASVPSNRSIGVGGSLRLIDERIADGRIYDAEIPVYSTKEKAGAPVMVRATVTLFELDREWRLVSLTFH